MNNSTPLNVDNIKSILDRRLGPCAMSEIHTINRMLDFLRDNAHKCNSCEDSNEWTFHEDEFNAAGERVSKHHYTCNGCGSVTQVG